MHRYLIGADPELLLQDQKGKFISAVGLFGGTKSEPRPILDKPGFAVQEDNVTVEFNIPPEDESRKFVRNIYMVVNYLEELAAKMNLKVSVTPSAVFDEDQLQTEAAQTFGCEPDFNVWSMEMNPRPSAKNKRLRSAGGHLHLAHTKDRIGLGRACDLFIGCPSIMHDPDIMRRELYGKAGAIREKTYGMEYRTPSNYWLKSPNLTEMVFEQAQQAMAFVDSGASIPDDDAVKIIKCINNSDQKLLRDLTSKYKLQF